MTTPPSGPPRIWTFVGTYTQESGGEYWIVEGPRPTEKNKFDLVERSAYDELKRDWGEAERRLHDKYAAALVERDQLRSACEMLAWYARHSEDCIAFAPRDCDGDIIECRCGYEEALAQYERIKRQLAGEK